MDFFADTIAELHSFLEKTKHKSSWPVDDRARWPCGGGRNIVLREDMALELGSPETESLSCLLWTEDLSGIASGRITMVGPDFPECVGRSLPFGKAIILGVEGFTADNAYDRHRDLDLLRYDLDLKGFMIRAVSQYMLEWCRISGEAIRSGFSARVLGSAIARAYGKVPYVRAVEVVFFTSSAHDVGRLKEITAPSRKVIAAMTKMAAEVDFDCTACDYRDVCEEAEGLKDMRDRFRRSAGGAVHA